MPKKLPKNFQSSQKYHTKYDKTAMVQKKLKIPICCKLYLMEWLCSGIYIPDYLFGYIERLRHGEATILNYNRYDCD